MKNKVILIYPRIDYEENYKYSWTPYSLLSIASVLVNHQIEPIIIDQNIDPTPKDFEKVKAVIEDSICIGFSIMTGGSQIRHALKFASKIREHFPKVPLVWGGPHVSALPDQTIKHKLVDIAVLNQGEITMTEVALSLQKDVGNLCQIKGIYFKKERRIFKNELRPLMLKKNLPAYSWNSLDINKYIRDDKTINTRTFGYISSQGCPYKCKFCYEYGVYHSWWSGFSSEMINKDVRWLVKNHGINGVKFYDADFFVNLKRIEQFCIEMDHNGSIPWAGSAHPNDILRIQSKKPSLLTLIKDTKCRRILMGIESGSDNTLKMINKKVNLKEVKSVIDIITDYDIIGSFTFIVGFPNETTEDLKKTLRLINYIHNKSTKHESRVHIFAPYPGTPLFNISIEKGFKPPMTLESWSNYNYYLPQTPWVSKDMLKILNDYTKMH